MKKIWNRFTAWLSGWPEYKEKDQMIKKNNKDIGKKPRKKTEIMN